MSSNDKILLTDCPRDAIQGIKQFIPTDRKVNYLNSLLASGMFDFIDFGSFVSPKAVPQFADTAQVLEGLENNGGCKLIAIIANEQGARIAAPMGKIDYVGYPFSISDTFQRRNTKQSIQQAFASVRTINDMLNRTGGPRLMVYISMAFGNPYGDLWDEEMVLTWMHQLKELGINKFSIADTTSTATSEQIGSLFKRVSSEFTQAELSLHLHSHPQYASSKIEAAYQAGCRIFEGAISGYGGCPFAQDQLVGNIPSELLLRRFKGIAEHKINAVISDFNHMIVDAI